MKSIEQIEAEYAETGVVDWQAMAISMGAQLHETTELLDRATKRLNGSGRHQFITREAGRVTGPEVIGAIINRFVDTDGTLIELTQEQVQGIMALFGKPVFEDEGCHANAGCDCDESDEHEESELTEGLEDLAIMLSNIFGNPVRFKDITPK